jgi:hypothetical protein
LSYENGKDIKVALNSSKFLFFFWLHSKNFNFASASANFDYWLGKEKQNAIFSHF